MIKIKKKGEFVFWVMFILVFWYYSDKHWEERREFKEKLLKNAAYATGSISFYNPSARFFSKTRQPAFVKYEFIVGDSLIKHQYGADLNYVPDEGVEIGEKYLVLYKKGNPKENRMFFDYRIKDSTDFKRYIKEIEKKRKQKI